MEFKIGKENIVNNLSRDEKSGLEDADSFLDYIDKYIPAIRVDLDKLYTSDFDKNKMISIIDHLIGLYYPVSEKMTTFYNEQREKKGIDNDSATYLNLLHKLKNRIVNPPLLLELIKEDLDYFNELSEENRKNLDFIKNSILHWESLSKNIRSLEGSKLDVEEINVTDIVNNSIKDASGDFTNKNINLSLDTNENYNVMADSLQLKTIIDDIIKNAVKFTNNNGHINISIIRVNELVQIKIKDDGVGISKNIQEQLLKDSVTSSTGTKGEKGTGTGLFISSIIMNKMSGNIKIESEGEGKGTTVILTLPKGKE